MNRRKFLGMLAAAPIAGKAAHVLEFFSTPAPVVASIAQYEDFISISQLADTAAIDPIVAQCAAELGYRAGQTVDFLYAQAFDAAAA